MNPLARRDGLVIRDLSDETIVYDRERHQAHCLNRTSAAVFRLCDGERDAGEIASLLDGPEEPGVREAIVADALGQLADARLLADIAGAPAAPTVLAASTTPAPNDAADPSRRALLRRLGTALLVPAIVSIPAPTPAQAASACLPLVSCSDPGNWCQPCAPLIAGDCSDGFICGDSECNSATPSVCP